MTKIIEDLSEVDLTSSITDLLLEEPQQFAASQLEKEIDQLNTWLHQKYWYRLIFDDNNVIVNDSNTLKDLYYTRTHNFLAAKDKFTFLEQQICKI